MTTVAVLHPGAMGAACGAALVAAGHDVVWCRAGRSDATATRAEAAGLRGVDRLEDVAGPVAVVISLCPPAAAAAVAGAVGATGFAGIYVDANAISPGAVRSLAGCFRAAATLVDGSVIGPPPSAERPGATRMHLSGPPAATALVAGLFTASPVDVFVVGEEIGTASGLKMAFASWSKGSAALAATAQALGRAYGVEDALFAEWERGGGAPVPAATLQRAGAAGWRWSGEMEEIAAACRDAGLPDATFLGFAAVYERWAHHRDDRTVALDELIDDLST